MFPAWHRLLQDTIRRKPYLIANGTTFLVVLGLNRANGRRCAQAVVWASYKQVGTRQWPSRSTPIERPFQSRVLCATKTSRQGRVMRFRAVPIKSGYFTSGLLALAGSVDQF